MKQVLSMFLFVLLFFSCTDFDEYGTNAPVTQSGISALDVSANFIKLADDSTQTAGVLVLTSNSPELSIKWNVNPHFNLDTTQTALSMSGGKCELPIKWRKKLENGTYGPIGMAFDGGVLVSSEEGSKYVRLIWADRIDSVKVAKSAQVLTRATERDMPIPADVIIEPVLLELDTDTCGSVTVIFNDNFGMCTVDPIYLDMLEGWGRPTGIDIMALPASLITSPTMVKYEWTGRVAPEEGFMAHLEYGVGDFYAFSYLRYKVPEKAQFEFISCEPDTLQLLDATKAYVIVKVNTNKIWSLECDDSDIKTVKSASDATGEQILVIQVSDNPGQSNRTIRVRVKSQGELMKTLTYTQKPAMGSFKVVSVKPDKDLPLSSDPQEIKVEVNTTLDWWIMVNGDKKDIPGRLQEGSYSIPAYTGKDPRNINVIIGYGDTQVEIINYTQNAGDLILYKTNTLDNPIPVQGGTYNIIFQGTYTGEIQIQALVGTEVLASGIPVTNLNVPITVPNNYGSIKDRDIKFQYRLGVGEWVDIPDANRKQIGASVEKQILPSGPIPAAGGLYSCVFSGSYSGKIKLRATIDGVTDAIIGDGNCPGTANVTIPIYVGDGERDVKFEYLAEGGDWTTIETKKQYAQTINFSPVVPEGTIPASGGAYRCTFTGTYTGQLTFRARVSDVILDSKRKILDVFELTIPTNPIASDREIIFEYSRNGTDGWIEVDRRFQSANVKIDSDQPNVGDWGNGGNNNNDVEL